MSKFTSFAVVGAGTLGKAIVNSLLAQNVTVTVLTRSADKSFEGAKTAVVDYNNPQSITDALKGIEVVISAVSHTALAVQKDLIDPAKAAGAKLFVPSEYGMPTEGHTEGLFAVKDSHAKYAASIGLPTARFYVGYFLTPIGLGYITGFNVNGKVNVVGDPDALGSVTAISDIAGFMAYVLTQLPPSDLENKVFRIQGEKVSMKDIAKHLGTTVEVVDQLPGSSAPYTFLQGKYGAGRSSTGWDEVSKKEGEAGSSNHLWPGHKWVTLEEGIKQ